MKMKYLVAGFGLFCIAYAIILSGLSSRVDNVSLPGNGGEFGPLTVKKAKSSYELKVYNSVRLNKWSHVTVEVLDSKKQYLFGFGDGMWNEKGYDSDGAWHEHKFSYTMDVTFPKKGDYYFRIKSERNDGVGSNIQITVSKHKGSNIPFIMLGVFCLIAAALMHMVGGVMNPPKAQGARRFITPAVVVVVLVVLFIWALSYSRNGYGYQGYNGYHSGPSFFYWGGPSIYRDPSARQGSIGGSGHRGGGFSGGK